MTNLEKFQNFLFKSLFIATLTWMIIPNTLTICIFAGLLVIYSIVTFLKS